MSNACGVASCSGSTIQQVWRRVEAAPVIPSDLGLLLAGSDATDATASGCPDDTTLVHTIGASDLGSC
jgi:hypothetical protein